MWKSLIAALTLTACASEPAVTDTPNAPHERITFAGEIATADERSMCEAAGGEVRRDGMAGWEHCIQEYADAGAACSDASDCLGRCMIDGEFTAAGQPTDAGRCEANNSPFGCFQTVENGVATAALCVD